MQFVGGDKPRDELKDLEALEVVAYKEALADLVKAIAIADRLGKCPADF